MSAMDKAKAELTLIKARIKVGVFQAKGEGAAIQKFSTENHYAKLAPPKPEKAAKDNGKSASATA